ncbi:MAG: SMC-Scp complex subunit ScpB [Caldilineaceae bacterium]|nr:SMC-Scp complex subunit ScpB [Caldilineaceae bacterium]
MNSNETPPPAPFSSNGQHTEPFLEAADTETDDPTEMGLAETGAELGSEAAAVDTAPATPLRPEPSDALNEENADQPAEVPLLSTLESLLFVADEPVEPARLAQALRCPVADVQAALAHLRTEYETHNRGVRLQERNGKVQLVTNPAAAQAVEDFLSLDLTTKLSGPALETLAIVAYRQPVTRVQIEAVRGVDCSGMVRKLEQQGLVEEVGRMETPGRPILYGVTDLFLQHFGLTHLEELPALPELDADSLRAVMALVEE